MNFKLVGGSLSALLLAAALAGCTGGGQSGGGTGTATTFNSNDVIAKVGDSSVTRADLAQTLEGIYGEQLLPQLIDTQLLAEELKSKNLTVTDEEINAELTRIEEQDPTVKTAVEAGGPRVAVIKNQVRRNLTVQKLLTDGIEANEADEKKFFDTFATYYGTPTQVKLGILAASTKVRADQLKRSLDTKASTFEALAEEQKGKVATDQIAGQSTPDSGRFETPDEFASSRGIPPQLVANTIKALATAKKGTVLPTQALTPQGPFLIVKVVDRKEATKPDYEKVKAQVETDYKLGQAAINEIKKSPGNPAKLEDNVKSVIQFLGQPNPQTGAPGIKASLRDALTYILRPSSNNTLVKLRGAGKVQIDDSAYKEVAKEYQQPTAAPGAATDNSAAGNSATGNTAAANTAAANTATGNSAAPSTP